MVSRFGWLCADLFGFDRIGLDICGSNCADLGAFLRFRLDLGGCSRFEWIWLSLGELELVRPDSGT